MFVRIVDQITCNSTDSDALIKIRIIFKELHLNKSTILSGLYPQFAGFIDIGCYFFNGLAL